MRAGELNRALTRLTVGLEGLLRTSVVNQGLLPETDVRRIESGSELVKRLWPERSGYRAYMKSWVFGMANVYRHGGDAGTASEQALHVLCGAAIWADQIMQDRAAFEQIRDGLDQEVTRQFAAGALELQPTADLRLRRAAAAVEKSGTVEQLNSSCAGSFWRCAPQTAGTRIVEFSTGSRAARARAPRPSGRPGVRRVASGLWHVFKSRPVSGAVEQFSAQRAELARASDRIHAHRPPRVGDRLGNKGHARPRPAGSAPCTKTIVNSLAARTIPVATRSRSQSNVASERTVASAS